MNQSTRKLLGTAISVAFLCVYALIAMAIAVRVLPDTGGLLHLVFFTVVGLVWVLPMMVIIRWMQRPDR